MIFWLLAQIFPSRFFFFFYFNHFITDQVKIVGPVIQKNNSTSLFNKPHNLSYHSCLQHNMLKFFFLSVHFDFLSTLKVFQLFFLQCLDINHMVINQCFKGTFSYKMIKRGKVSKRRKIYNILCEISTNCYRCQQVKSVCCTSLCCYHGTAMHTLNIHTVFTLNIEGI